MAEQEKNSEQDITAGDIVMAFVSFFLTPLVPLILSIYNFARGRKSQGGLFITVFGFQLVLLFMLIAAS